MDVVQEIDEEQGGGAGAGQAVEVTSFSDVQGETQEGADENAEKEPEGDGVSRPNSAPVGARRRGEGGGKGGGKVSFASRRSHHDSDGPNSPSERFGNGNGISRWRSLAGSRMVKFASDRSDLNDDDARGIVATPLDSSRARPMAPGVRFFKNIQNEVEDAQPQFMRSGSSGQYRDDMGYSDSHPNQMYRLQATRDAKDLGCFRKTLRFISSCINCGALTESAAEQTTYRGFGDPNRMLIYFFFWLFRKGWVYVTLLSIVWFYILVVFFALLIVWAAELDNDCVKVGGADIGGLDNRSKFMDAFSLSWNTFSTVGYGSTYPALSPESNGDDGGDPRCVFISFLTSLEAFVGVIFAGFIGAIFFAKVSRISQQANVQFSDALTVRFGNGVDATVDEDGEHDDELQDEDEIKVVKADSMTASQKFQSMAKKVSTTSPFPVITFRIANEQHSTLGGEIINANVKAVALFESTRYDDEVSEDIAKQIAQDRMKRRSKDVPKMRKASKTGRSSGTSTERTNDTASLDEDSNLSESSGRSSLQETDNALALLQGLNALTHKARFGKKMKIDEEEGSTSSKIVPRIVFTKLELETYEFPLFKRIWRFKHHLNPDSPLLTAEAQQAIIDNGGHWPWKMNNHAAMRNAIQFKQMIVSFTGISNISGESVYKQKVYSMVDTAVGYQFVNVLYRGHGGNLKVDLRLISDVAEQTGGGAEPLND